MYLRDAQSFPRFRRQYESDSSSKHALLPLLQMPVFTNGFDQCSFQIAGPNSIACLVRVSDMHRVPVADGGIIFFKTIAPGSKADREAVMMTRIPAARVNGGGKARL